MSSAYQAARAAGTKGECRQGKVRHTVTIDQALFEVIRASAMAHGRSISEEMATRLTLQEAPLANSNP